MFWKAGEDTMPRNQHAELYAVRSTTALTTNSKIATPINLLPGLISPLEKWYGESRTGRTACAGLVTNHTDHTLLPIVTTPVY